MQISKLVYTEGRSGFPPLLALARAVRAKRVLVNYQRQAHTRIGTNTLCVFLHLGQRACVSSSRLRFVSLQPRSLVAASGGRSSWSSPPFRLIVCHQYWRHCCYQLLRARGQPRSESKLNYCATCALP